MGTSASVPSVCSGCCPTSQQTQYEQVSDTSDNNDLVAAMSRQTDEIGRIVVTQTRGLENTLANIMADRTGAVERRITDLVAEQMTAIEGRLTVLFTNRTEVLERRMDLLTEQVGATDRRVRELTVLLSDEPVRQQPRDVQQTLPKRTETSAPSSLSSSPSPSPSPATENDNAGNPIFVYGTLQIATSITNSNDNRELIAKLQWDAGKERERIDRLEQEIQERQHLLSEDEKRRHREQLAALRQHIQTERADLRCFQLTVDDRMSGVTSRLELLESRVNDVATRLYEQFHIRLLGVESGLACILDVPEANWRTVTEHQSEIQGLLASLLPENSRDDEVQWYLTPSLYPEEVDMRLQRQVQAATEERSQGEHDSDQTLQKLPHAVATSDPVLSPLEPRSFMETSVEDDALSPWITALLVTAARVFMVDNTNHKLKVFALAALHRPQHCVQLEVQPYGLALVTGRQLVAATSLSANVIVLIDIAATPVVRNQVATTRRYLGVGSCDDGTLVVSCDKDAHLPATVDVITLEGAVVRTIASSDEAKGLISPDYLCVAGGTVYLSDWDSNCVHRADLVTGRLTTLPSHPRLRSPRQVNADRAGNLYVACGDSQCVLVRTAAGAWRELLRGTRDGEGERAYAWCVCVTDTGLLLVSWEVWLGVDTVVKVYQIT